ncbi:MAG: hypothetical protein ACSHXH_03465 [Marivita sp.]|uniref:hypothetical protein n=1 Tax=Marivita sp. TaxID=2003365 RepID=UPI003EF83884
MALEDTDRQILPCPPHRLDGETQWSDCHIPFAREHDTGVTGAVFVRSQNKKRISYALPDNRQTDRRW